MKYSNTYSGKFISRPNRFIANIEIDGKPVVVHVKNTGRCRELLIPGARVILEKSDNPNRKTGYDLIAVYKATSSNSSEKSRLVNMDSQAPNKVFYEYLRSGKYIDGITQIKPEKKYGSSRFDFYVETAERRIFIEVKGVTLENDGVVLFPDAPTERGVKHLNELAKSIDEGYEAHVVFVIQMKGIKYFTPNNVTHPAFGEALIAADKAGVKVIALDCEVTENSLVICDPVQVKL